MEFFLTTPPTPYELRGKATSAENFENLLAYLGLPVFARALKEVRSTSSAHFFCPIEGEQLLRPAHAAKREPSHGRKPRLIGRGRCGPEFRRSEQIAVHRAAHGNDAAHFVDRRSNHGEVQPFVAPDIPVKNVPRVQAEAHLRDGPSLRLAAGI